MADSMVASRPITVFMLVKTSVEWLAMSVEDRLARVSEYMTPILNEHRETVKLSWYDVEFYTARITDVWMIEARDHENYQLFCEGLRETPFWDRFFYVEEILPGERNAWATNYRLDAASVGIETR